MIEQPGKGPNHSTELIMCDHRAPPSHLSQPVAARTHRFYILSCNIKHPSKKGFHRLIKTEIHGLGGDIPGSHKLVPIFIHRFFFDKDLLCRFISVIEKL